MEESSCQKWQEVTLKGLILGVTTELSFVCLGHKLHLASACKLPEAHLLCPRCPFSIAGCMCNFCPIQQHSWGYQCVLRAQGGGPPLLPSFPTEAWWWPSLLAWEKVCSVPPLQSKLWPTANQAEVRAPLHYKMFVFLFSDNPGCSFCLKTLERPCLFPCKMLCLI